jgi:hypothetical protein
MGVFLVSMGFGALIRLGYHSGLRTGSVRSANRRALSDIPAWEVLVLSESSLSMLMTTRRNEYYLLDANNFCAAGHLSCRVEMVGFSGESISPHLY